MSRLTALFREKKRRVLNVYFTAGHPTLDSVLPIMSSLQDAAVDIIELGMPYSDPLADGLVIQKSSQQAIANGMTIEVLFEQLKGFRKHIHIPVVLMGYLNPVLQYGFDAFCRQAAEAGIDGLIIPDLPSFSYQKEYKDTVTGYGLDMIFLVTPETAAARVLELDALSSGFLYAVSSSGITGQGGAGSGFDAYMDKLNALPLKNPLLVGFGISDKAGFERVAGRANGGIIGSAFIKALDGQKDVKAATKAFLSSIIG